MGKHLPPKSMVTFRFSLFSLEPPTPPLKVWFYCEHTEMSLTVFLNLHTIIHATMYQNKLAENIQKKRKRRKKGRIKLKSPF